MGLIDNVRKKRDSWISRFEEHRQDEEYDAHNLDTAGEEERILGNRRKVGVFPKVQQGKDVKKK